MAELLKGAPVAAALGEGIAADVKALGARGITPTLALVRVGARPDDVAYENSAIKRCDKLGIETRRFVLEEDAAQSELLAVIDKINRDGAIHGCLIFRPLPGRFDDDAVRNALAPEKDVDGIGDGSLCGVFAGTDKGFAPCTAAACMEILRYYGYDPAGKRAVVVGRSLVVGKPAAMLLLARNATVTVCHTRTEDMPSVTRNAEILIAAAGRASVIGAQHLSPGQVVVDVGINVGPDGALCGDVNFDEAASIVGAITPVPGGVGAVTTCVLARHVVDAAGRAAKEN